MNTQNKLLPHHQEMLYQQSGILPKISEQRGCRSVTTKSELKSLGFGESQRQVPTLLMPLWNTRGEIGMYHHRPDEPRIDAKRGKPIKYEFPKGSCMMVDVHPSLTAKIRDPEVSLFITEGVKKADAAISRGLTCVALAGVHNFRGTNEFGGKTVLPDFDDIAFNGRLCYIVFDSDCRTNPHVFAAMERLAGVLRHRKAMVRFILFPSQNDGKKVGMDDFFVAGYSIQDLLDLACEELPPAPFVASEIDETPEYNYVSTPNGIIWQKQTENGPVNTRLTNFEARLVGETIEDDGIEEHRLYEIEARCHDQNSRFSIPAQDYGNLNWIAEHLGAGAYLYPGISRKEHARFAIQQLSDRPPIYRVHTHTGWRKIASGQWAYLHGQGSIGANKDAHESLSVRLPPNLKNFVLPVPPQQAELIEAVRCALRFCQLGPSEICAPLFAAVWRSCLDSADFSIFLVGPSGAFKSEIAALAQQFFGADFSARDLPGAWSSTDNALEATAFLLKDALFVIDDFAPRGSHYEMQKWHAKADRILRAQGNNSARSRMSRERGLHADKPPRGLILATGEDIPQGHSIRARTLLIEASKGAISDKVLTLCQNEARSGAYAKAMSGFLSWLAPRYDEMLAALPGAAMQWRDKATQQHLHRRTPAIIGQLAVGLRTFFDFAQELGVLPASQADEEFAHGWQALQKAAVRHESDQNSSEPTKRFAELLQAALASGQAHVANLSGDEPQMPEGWGWRREPSGSMYTEWKPQGQRIGWMQDDDLFLNLDVAYNVAHRLGELSGDALALSARTIAKRLNECGWLVTTEQMAGRQTLRVRKTIEGRRMEVLHLRAEIVYEKPDQPDQSSLA